MNQVLEARSPAKAATKARANRAVRNAERLNITEALKALQARRLRIRLGCSEATAYTLASLAYGEGRS